MLPVILISIIVIKTIVAFFSPVWAAIISAIIGMIIAHTVAEEYNQASQKAIVYVPYTAMLAVSGAFGSTWPWYFVIFGAILLAGAYLLFDNSKEFTSAITVDLIMMIDMMPTGKFVPLIIGYATIIGIAIIAHVRAPADEKTSTRKRLVLLSFCFIGALTLAYAIWSWL